MRGVGVLPGFPASGEGVDVRVAHALEVVGGEGGAVAAAAVEYELGVVVGDGVFDVALYDAAAHVLCAARVAALPLVVFANVYELRARLHAFQSARNVYLAHARPGVVDDFQESFGVFHFVFGLSLSAVLKLEGGRVRAPSGLTFVFALCYIITLPANPVETFMRLKAAPTLLLSLACVLASAGCQRATRPSETGGVGRDLSEMVSAVNAFTGELVSKVEKAEDSKEGLAQAQKLLDARKGELAARVAAARNSPESKSNASARTTLLEAEVDNTERVHRLQVEYADASARDPDFKARLDKLVSDYDSIFK